jgi:hypothetical protein
MKNGISIILFMLCGLQGFSQNRFGIIGGYTATDFKIVPDIQKSQAIEGAMVGFMYEQNLGSLAYFHTSTMFVNKGGILNKVKVKLSYVEETAMLKFGNHLYLEGGFTFGYLLSARGIGSKGSGNIKYGFSNFDLGFAGGLGFRIGPLVLEGRYASSLLNTISEGEQAEVFNRGVYLLAGISIPIGGKF